MWRNTLLKKVQKYICNHLNPVKVYTIDPRIGKFVQLLSIPEILAELKILDDDYCKSLSLSKDDGRELHLKGKSDSCFANKYFNDGLKCWQENMDTQPVFNEYEAVEYKTVTYMWSYS